MEFLIGGAIVFGLIGLFAGSRDTTPPPRRRQTHRPNFSQAAGRAAPSVGYQRMTGTGAYGRAFSPRRR